MTCIAALLIITGLAGDRHETPYCWLDCWTVAAQITEQTSNEARCVLEWRE